MSIYKPCDIRGKAGSELTPELYRRWGRALGAQVEPRAKFVVGGDVRFSTPEYLTALTDGLCQAGVDLVDLGILPTPMIYYAKRRLAAAGCAIVTASHNPADVNGLKWLLGDRPPEQKDVRGLKQLAEKEEADPDGRVLTRPRALDVTFDYVAWLQETWVGAPPLSQPIVLDAMHGVWACRARRYLQAVFPHSIFSAIHDTPNGSFAGRVPDPSRAELLEDLSEAVYHHGAALGIAFDGDGDRMALVDDDGNALTAEEAVWVLLQSYGDDLSGERFVYDIKFSDRIPEAARRLGAEPVVERSGHTFVRRRMLESGARFGAEISGHYFFRDLGGGDDGMFAACRVIAHLARTRERLADLRRGCPEVFVTPELRVGVKTQYCQEVIDQVRQTFAQFPQVELDGVRINFPDGWALIRRSVTEPALTFRFESGDWTSLSNLVWRFSDSIPEIGEVLWTRYEEAMGLSGDEPCPLSPVP